METPRTTEEVHPTSPCTQIVDRTQDERFTVYQAMSQNPIFDRRRVNAFDEAEWLRDVQRNCNPQ